LKSKFRRVFYVPGNAELNLYFSEVGKFTDCMAKLLSIYELCDELDVDIFPAAVAEDVFVVPLLSWYNPEFDVNDPVPDMRESESSTSKWPIDPDRQLWKFMMKLNEAHLNHFYHGTVISMSHFLPRRDLPFSPYNKAAKTCGCEELGDQIRRIGSKMHVYGHVQNRHLDVHDNIVYVNRYHGTSKEVEKNPQLLCIHDGWKHVRQEVSPVAPEDV